MVSDVCEGMSGDISRMIRVPLNVALRAPHVFQRHVVLAPLSYNVEAVWWAQKPVSHLRPIISSRPSTLRIKRRKKKHKTPQTVQKHQVTVWMLFQTLR